MKKSMLLSIGVIFSSLCLAQSKSNTTISPYRFKNFHKNYDDDITQATQNSYWKGASLAYNLDGSSAGNIIANTKFMINSMDLGVDGKTWKNLYWTLGVVGNFGNFLSSKEKTEVDRDIARISQSGQGLNIGFSFLGETERAKNSIFRVEYITSYRLNAFQNVGLDSTTVALNQFRNAITFEGEFSGFKNKGALSLSFELGYNIFDKRKFNEIFGYERSGILTGEATVILPISSNLGMLSSVTFAQKMSPKYQFGIYIKPNN